MVTKHHSRVEYAFHEGQAFAQAITTEKPPRVHIEYVPGEHGETYSFSFFDSERRVHDYMREIDKWADPVIGKEEIRTFQEKYGVPLVYGSVHYIREELHHVFDCYNRVYAEPVGMRVQQTYEAWQRAVEWQKNQDQSTGNDPITVRMVRTNSKGIIDVASGLDHYILSVRESEGYSLDTIIKDNIPEYNVIDVTPYKRWLDSVPK